MSLEKLPKVEYDSDFAVCCDDNQHLSLFLNETLYSIVRNSTDRTNILKTYHLIHHKENDINLTNKKSLHAYTSFKLFSFCNKLALLTGKHDFRTWNLRLYQLDQTTATCATWEQVAFSKYSISDSLFDFQNCIPVSHREDRVTLVSVLNDHVNANHCIAFHIFSQKVSGRNWKATRSLLPIQFTSTAEYQLQSCILVSDYIYCSLLLHGIGAFIYKFDLLLLQQQRNISIRPDCDWHIRELALQSCFLSVLQEEVIIISFKSISNRSFMEVSRLKNFLPVPPADYQFEYTCKVKITAASIISASMLVVMHHDDKSNTSVIKTFTM